MTLPPTQNLPPPVFLRVLHYRLRYFPFTFLTCRILHTHTSPYTQTTLSFYLSLGVVTLSPADSVTLYKPTQILSPHGNSNYTHTKTETILFFKCPFPDTLQIQYLQTINNKATCILCNIFPLLAQDSMLTQSQLTLYKLLIQSILTHAAPVWSSPMSIQLPHTPSYPVQVSSSHQ